MEDAQAIPKCPGCHFGCNLAKYQCARGKKIFAKWEAGEPIPERRVPWKQPPAGTESSEAANSPLPQEGKSLAEGIAVQKRPSIPPQMRAMHMLNIAAIAMGDHRETRVDLLTIDTIARHDGAATLPIIKGRTKCETTALKEALETLASEGVIETLDDEAAGCMYALTKAGQERAAEGRAEREAADAEFLDALSDDEKSQLADLIAKMLQSTAHQRRMATMKR